MPDKHIITKDGKWVTVSDDELYHWKYVKREKKNGKWVYTYPNDKLGIKNFIDTKITGKAYEQQMDSASKTKSYLEEEKKQITNSRSFMEKQLSTQINDQKAIKAAKAAEDAQHDPEKIKKEIEKLRPGTTEYYDAKQRLMDAYTYQQDKNAVKIDTVTVTSDGRKIVNAPTSHQILETSWTIDDLKSRENSIGETIKKYKAEIDDATENYYNRSLVGIGKKTIKNGRKRIARMLNRLADRID